MRFKSKVFATFCAAFFPISSWAQCSGPDYLSSLEPDTVAAITARADAVPFGQGLIWQATRGDAKITLLGTMHLYDDRHQDLMIRVTPFLQESDLILLEMTPEVEAQAQSGMLSNPEMLFLPLDSPTLPELLPAEDWDMLASEISKRGIPSILAAKSQPWYIAMSLAIPTCAMADIASGKRGLDHMIMDWATTHSVDMQALEPWDTLFTIMSADSFEDQLTNLQLTLQTISDQPPLMMSLLNEYFEEKPALIWEISRYSVENTPGISPADAAMLMQDMQTDLLDTRNANWIPVITAASAQNDTMVVAVGAAHLPGETGVLRLLEQQGWTITPVN